MIPIFYPEGQLGWGEDTIESAENALEAIVFNYTVVLSNEDTSSFHSKPPSLNSSPSIRSISTIDSRINKLSNNPTIIKSGSASKSALFMNFKGENSTFSQQPATTKPPLASKPRIKPELSNHVLIHEPSYPSPEFILGPRVPVDEDSNVNPLPDAVSNDSSLVDELTVEQAGEKEFSELLMDKQDLLEDLSPKPVANMEDTGKQFLSDTIDGESLQNQVQSKVQVSTGTKEFAEHMFSSLTLHELFQPLKFDQNLLETLAKKAELTEDPLESLEVD